MSAPGALRFTFSAILALGLAACAPQPGTTQTGAAPGAAAPATVKSRSASEQRLGDENHQKILQKYGGVYNNARLTSYVNELGRRIARVSEQPNEKWTFTVLDNPTINAFALPGGYVYVTRGLVGLANSEAELAGVIGHEIGHVTAGHSSLRQERATIATGALLGAQILGAVLGADPNLVKGVTQIGQVAAGGILADYSRGDELAADNLGIRYLARAGYDPYAQADFLESMGASSSLDARMAGKSYNPNATNFLASHPANGPRTRRAIEVAQNSGEIIPVGASRDRDRFLQVIDGLEYGDSAEQGFVRGRTFSHPKLRFTYESPSGFTIVNSSAAVTAKGPGNARFVLDGGRNLPGSLSNYISRTWAPAIAKEYRVGRLSRVTPRRINGLEAASGYLPVQVNGKAFDAMLTAIRLDGKLYRLTGLVPRGSGLMGQVERAAQSFRSLSPREARQLKPQRIDIVRVRRGDTVAGLARRMNVDSFHEERFRVLNGLGPSDRLSSGQRVKIIR